MNSQKQQLWDNMSVLVTDVTLSEMEKEILGIADKALRGGLDEEMIAIDLKHELSFLSSNQPLSKNMGPFLTELSRLYLDYDRRDNMSIWGIISRCTIEAGIINKLARGERCDKSYCFKQLCEKKWDE